MNEVEEDKFIEWLEFQFSFNMHNVTKIAVKSRLKQYAQQVSREMAIEFAEHCIHNTPLETLGDNIEKDFDDWQKQK